VQDPLIEAVIGAERLAHSSYRRLRAARRAWQANVRRARMVLEGSVARRWPRLKFWESILADQPWYIKRLYIRYRRFAELLIVLREVVRRLRPRRRLTPLALRLASMLVFRVRRRLWGEAQWRAYSLDLIRFYAELYLRITDRIFREAEAVVPLFTVYFNRNWEYIGHSWAAAELARLEPRLREDLIRSLREAFRKGVPWRVLSLQYPDVAAFLLYLAYRELGLDIARRSQVVVLPVIFEEAAGRYGVLFYAVYLPRRLAEPDPYIGATRPPPVRHFDYIWKFEYEDVPVKSPFEEYDQFATLFDELGNIYFESRFKPLLVDTYFEEAMTLGSHGLWERVGMSVLRGFFGAVGRTFATFELRSRGSYYLVRTVLHHLGLR